MFKLLTPGAWSPKLAGEAGVLTAILYLDGGAAPTEAGICPAATPECRATCLVSTAGRARFPAVLAARARRRDLYVQNRPRFLQVLTEDLQRLVARARKLGVPATVRLNGGSDVDWGWVWSYAQSLGIRTWEYTKRPDLARRMQAAGVHVTFSYTGYNTAVATRLLRTGVNVAVVFRGGLPQTWAGHRVISGDATDLRWTDPPGVVVGLKAKGEARRGGGVFVVDGQQTLVVDVEVPNYA